jgi:DNA gyrase/topoisomerase IV subunit B
VLFRSALLDFPPAPKLNVFGTLNPQKATPAELRGQKVFFGKGKIVYSFDTLANRLRELAFLNKNVRITLKDERAKDKFAEFQFSGGIVSFVEFLSTCSVNWKMPILSAKRYVNEHVIKKYPLGLFKDKLGVEKQ